MLTDSPLRDAGVEQVNVAIQQVSAHVGSAWQTLVDTPRTVDLMTLQNGVTTPLGTQSLPPGHYTQIRLLTATDGNNLVVNGTQVPLVVPSGSQTGLKIPFVFDVRPGGTYDLTLDFVASDSVVQTGHGQWLLKPVIQVRDFTETPDSGDSGQHACDTGPGAEECHEADTAEHHEHEDGNDTGDTGEPGCHGGSHGHDTGWHGGSHDTGEHSGDTGEHDSGD